MNALALPTTLLSLTGRAPRSGKQRRARQCLFVLLAIPDHLDGQGLAPWALKGAPIVTGLLGLDANEPHIGYRRVRNTDEGSSAIAEMLAVARHPALLWSKF